MDVIFDIGEIGWACYHRAYLQWRYKNGEHPPKVQLWTLPDRFSFYESFLYTEIKEVPKSLQGNRRRNCFLCSNFDINKIFKQEKIDPTSVVNVFNCIRPSPPYRGKMIFKPHKILDGSINAYNRKKVAAGLSGKNIVVMPRQKEKMKRNWGESNWNSLLQIMVNKLDYNIILCGLDIQSTPIRIQSSKIMNLISSDPFMNTLCALNDSDTILCAASQSFGGKLSLLQNCNTIMWGHQDKRHAVEENWSTDPKTICKFIHTSHYDINPQEIFTHIKNLLHKLQGDMYEESNL